MASLFVVPADSLHVHIAQNSSVQCQESCKRLVCVAGVDRFLVPCVSPCSSLNSSRCSFTSLTWLLQGHALSLSTWGWDLVQCYRLSIILTTLTTVNLQVNMSHTHTHTHTQNKCTYAYAHHSPTYTHTPVHK